jgi:hypothetical protein
LATVANVFPSLCENVPFEVQYCRRDAVTA